MKRLLFAAALTVAPACHASDQTDTESPTPSPKVVSDQPQASAGATVTVDPEVTAEFRQERDEFVAESKVRLAKIDARIDAIQADLDANATKLKAETKAELLELRADLEQQRVKVKASFHAAANVTADGWAEFKRDFNDAMDRLEAGAKTTVGKLKSAGIKVRVEIEDALD